MIRLWTSLEGHSASYIGLLMALGILLPALVSSCVLGSHNPSLREQGWACCLQPGDQKAGILTPLAILDICSVSDSDSYFFFELFILYCSVAN